MYLKLKDMEHELYDFGNVQLPQEVRASREYHELEELVSRRLICEAESPPTPPCTRGCFSTAACDLQRHMRVVH